MDADRNKITGAQKSLIDVVFHVFAPPMTALRDEFSPDAFTMKTVRLCRMMQSLGLRSILYANEGSESQCGDTIIILKDRERQFFFGSDEKWKHGAPFSFDNVEGRKLITDRITKAIENITRNRDDDNIHILLCTFGNFHQPVADETGLVAIETGIGYTGTFANYQIFESYTWLHTLKGNTPVNHYHAVIPNCYYEEEFKGVAPVSETSYFAFIGRVIEDKGILIALKILDHMPSDISLHVAGQGDLKSFVPDSHPHSDRIIYHGVVGPNKRNAILSGAIALLAPTTGYREPFGGVMVEAQFFGTPVITTDHAAMSETVWHGITGFRCRSLRCFVAAAQEVQQLDRNVIMQRAKETYTCDRIKYQYEDYFQDILNLFRPEGWNVIDGGPGHTLSQRDYYPASNVKFGRVRLTVTFCAMLFLSAVGSVLVLTWQKQQQRKKKST